MRKNARIFPEIEIEESMGFPNFRYTKYNEILMNDDCGDLHEEEMIVLLNHEIDHWAQFMFVNQDIMNGCFAIADEEAEKGRIPFLERINRFNTDEIKERLELDGYGIKDGMEARE